MMIIIIQISEQYLKLVFARYYGGRLRVVASFVEIITSLNDAQIVGKMQSTLKKIKARPRFVVLSLSRNMTTVRNLHLPTQNEEELAQMVDLNIVRMVPYKKEDIVFGYRVLGFDERGYTRAIVAIVKTDIIRRFVSIIEKAGLSVDRIVLGSYGVWKKAKTHIGAGSPPSDLFLALDVDADFTDLIIFSNDNLNFSRSMNIGARALGDSEAGTVKFINEIRQLRQCLMMFYNEEINKKPRKILLCGAKAGRKLLPEIESELGIVVELVEDHSGSIPDDVSLASLNGFDPQGADDIDFVLPEMQVRKALRQTTRDLVVLGALCIYILTMVCGLYWGRNYHRENYLTRLSSMITATEKDLGDLPLKLHKIEFVKEYLVDRTIPFFIFSHLQRAIPQRVALTSFSVDEKGRVVLRGQAFELADVFKFIDNLDQTGHFKEVQTRSTKKKKVKDKDVTEFELSFILN